jgi:hypothetical protein
MTNEQEELDSVVEQHLMEAKINRDKNMQIMANALK